MPIKRKKMEKISTLAKQTKKIDNRKKEKPIKTKSGSKKDDKHSFDSMINYDITKGKKAEDILRENESRFKAIFENANIGICFVGLDGRLLKVNKEMSRMFGYSCEELEQMDVNSITHSKDKDISPDFINKAILDKVKQGSFDKRYIHKDGHVIWGHVSSSLVKDFNGKPLYFISHIQDITEQKKAEAALRESEEKFRTFAEQSPNMIFINKKERVVYANAKCEEVMGYTREEFYSPDFDFLKMIAPEYVDTLKEYFKRHMKGEEVPPYESAVITKQGKRLEVIITTKLIPYENERAILGIITDITERKSAEARLMENEEKFRKAFLNSPSIMGISTQPDGRFIDINDKFTEILEWKREEVIGHTSKELNIFVDYSKRNEMIELIKKKGSLKGYEIQLRTKSGKIKDVEFFAELIELNQQPYLLAQVNDITERKKIENELKRVVREWQSTFDSSSDAYCVLDEEQRIKRANMAMLNMFSITQENLIGKRCWEIVHNSMEPIHNCPIQRMQKSLRREMMELKIGDFTYDVTVDPILDDTKKIVGAVHVIRDITEKVRAENLLRENEERYRVLFSAVREAIFVADIATGMLIDCNESACELVERSKEEIIGKHQSILHPPQDLVNGHSRSYKQHLIGITSEVLSDRVITKSGKIKEVEIKASIIEVRGKKLMHGVFTDVTERNKVERDLRASEERFKRLVESVTDYIYSVKLKDGHPVKTYHGPACVTVTGYTSEEYEKDPGLWYRMVYDGDKLLVEELIKKVISGKEISPIEHRIIHKDGSVRWIRNTPVPQYDAEGNLTTYDGLITDITERKYLEEQLIQSQKMESLGVLAGGIAHDFNNILGIILGYSKLLESKTIDDKKFAECISAINQTVRRGATLVGQILTYARKTETNFEPVNIEEIIHELISLLTQTFPKTISFDERIEKDIPMILADRTQLHQAFLNLLVNARDALPSGGNIMIGVNKISMEAMRSRFPSANKQWYICISISDTGEGIDELNIKKIFDPFFTTKPIGKGTGMGLPVAHSIIDSHGGFIDVESKVGKGTTFKIYLPVPDIALVNKKSIKETEKIFNIGGTETILVVEDEAFLLDMLRVMLESKGYKTHVAFDGTSAIEIYKRYKDEISLVLTDMGLPGMTGLDEFKQLKEINSNVKVVFASGFVESSIKAELYKAGAKGFIQKPYDISDVLRTIREVLDKP